MKRISTQSTLYFLLAIIFLNSLTVSAQQKDVANLKLRPLTMPTNKTVTIKGNIKRLPLLPGDLGKYKFRYTDLLTGKKISIAIKTDTAGNFNVAVPLTGLQQLQLVQLEKIGDKVIDGSIAFFFYAKPGNDMELNYYLSADRKVRSITFKGSLAELNNQDRSYQDKLEFTPFQPLIEFSKLDSVRPENYAGYEKYVAERLNMALAYNAQYFSSVKTDPYLQRLADANIRYTAANMLINGAISASADASALDNFFSANKIKINDSAAFSNSNYKLFVHGYYVKYIQDALKGHNQVTITNPQMGAYLLKNHPQLTEQDKELARRMMDTVNKIQGAEKKRAIEELMKPYGEEYVATVKTKILFDHLSQIDDPSIREIFITKQLTEAMDNYGVVVVQQLIEAYKRKVRPGKFKDEFLKRYNSEYKRVFESKLSAQSTLNDSEKISPDSLIANIKSKHKGKVVFIDVWATWCKPCLLAMPGSKILREKLKGKEVVFVYLCMDSQSKSQWKNLIASNKIEGDNYFLSKPQAQALVDQFYITKIPRYIILDKDGNVKNEDAKGPNDVKTLDELKSCL